MSNNKNFGPIDIPMMCSLFLEPAINIHEQYLPTISLDTKKYIHEWNKALISIIKLPQFHNYIGDYGKQILRGTSLSPSYTEKCVTLGSDTHIQSLQYAIRFSYAWNFLTTTVPNTQNHGFIDYGCGLSPLCASIQTTQNLQNAYCIDKNPQICEIYNQTANAVCGHSPTISTPITANTPCAAWKKNRYFLEKNKIESLVAVGVLPYIQFEQQRFMLYFIERNLKNFFLEIKYQVPFLSTQNTSYNISATPSIYFTQNSFDSSKFNNQDNILHNIAQTTHNYFTTFIRGAGIDNINYLRHIRSAFIDSRCLITNR